MKGHESMIAEYHVHCQTTSWYAGREPFLEYQSCSTVIKATLCPKVNPFWPNDDLAHCFSLRPCSAAFREPQASGILSAPPLSPDLYNALPSIWTGGLQLNTHTNTPRYLGYFFFNISISLKNIGPSFLPEISSYIYFQGIFYTSPKSSWYSLSTFALFMPSINSASHHNSYCKSCLYP